MNTEIKQKLIKAGVKNMHEFGYENCNESNILTDDVYSQFFLVMLESNLGNGVDDEINSLIAEIALTETTNNETEYEQRNNRHGKNGLAGKKFDEYIPQSRILLG